MLFWLLLFQVARTAFFILNILPTGDPVSGWPLIFLHGFRLDLSMSCYLSAIPFLLWFAGGIYPALLKFIKAVVYIETALLLILLVANIQVYKAWGTLINRRAFTFLADPAGIIASLSLLQMVSGTMILAIILFLIFRFQRRFLLDFNETPKTDIRNSLIRFSLLLLLPVGIRGGLQQIPVNESAAAFSTNMQLNNAAMNPAWYFANNLLKSGLNQKNPYAYFPVQQAEDIVSGLFIKSGSTTPLLNTARPDIIIIALESWTADIIESLDGEKDITPFFNELTKEGLLFRKIYSSGRRTDQMFPSVLSGFPAQPNYSIIRFPSKTEQLPMLSRDLKQAGYHTSFYYGGELGFANMRTYLLQGKFDTLISKDDFKDVPQMSKWGAHDEFVLQKHAKDLVSLPSPYFTFLLTLTTHEPFDYPGNSNGGVSEADKFRNASKYTDACLRNYFDQLCKLPRWQNTLVVLVADHGHLLPKGRTYTDPAVYRIPLLLAGGALKEEFRGKTISMTGSQHDLPATLLRQLHLNTDRYQFSNDLLDPARRSFAYLNMDDASALIEEDSSLVWYPALKQEDANFTRPALKKDDLRLMKLKAYQQVLFHEFLKN